ncbi:MAG: reverse transcriptase [Spirochaetes bacterium]|nr:MAG: reverse transcriptase [Spirochaetota bacterium]
MDDVICLRHAREDLHSIYDYVSDFAANRLDLLLKPKIVDSCRAGIPFLGFLIMPWGIYPSEKTKQRFKKRYRRLLHEFEAGTSTEEEFARRTISICSHLELARSRRFMQDVVYGRVLGRQSR